MASYLFFRIRYYSHILAFPLIAVYSSFWYLMGRSKDTSPVLKYHLLKLLSRVLDNARADAQIAKLQPPLSFPDVLKSVPTNTAGFSDAHAYGSICSEFPSGRNVYWVHKHPDIRSTDPVILYYHGGALYLQATMHHIIYLLALLKALLLKTPSSRISIAIVDYALLPNHTFPVQLQDSIDAYDDITVRQGFKNVILTGDSAGGLLVMTLMAARKRSPPQSLNPPKSSVEPNGSILFFPWAGSKGAVETGSYERNKESDIVTAESLRYWATLYANNNKELFETPWISPSKGSKEFWANVIKPARTFVLYGSGEILADDIEKWIDLVEIPSTNVHVDVNGCHASPMIQFGLTKPELRFQVPSFLKVVSWLEDLTKDPPVQNDASKLNAADC